MNISFNKNCQPLEPAKMHRTQPIMRKNQNSLTTNNLNSSNQNTNNKKLKLDVCG